MTPVAQKDAKAEPCLKSIWLPEFLSCLRENEYGPSPRPSRRLHAECGICFKLLDISTKVGQLLDKEILAGQAETLTVEEFYTKMQCELEKTAFLSCGHVVGNTCLAKWVAGQAKPKCPFCRTDIGCSQCGAALSLQFPVLRRPLGRYNFFPYEMIDCQIPWTNGEREDGGPPKNRYCGKCVSQKAVHLMTALFVNKEACPLCHQEDGARQQKNETAEEHRAKRQRAADAIFEERLRGMLTLAHPPRGLRPNPGGRQVEEWKRQWRLQRFDRLKNHEGMLNLKRRIFRDCPFTRDTAGPQTRLDRADLKGLKRTVERFCHDTEASAYGFVDIDEWMAVDTTMPPAVPDRGPGYWVFPPGRAREDN